MQRSKNKKESGESVPLLDERTHVCFDASHHQRHPSRLGWAEASWSRWLQVLWWCWLNPIISLGYKQALTDDDLEDLPDDDKCSLLLKNIRSDNMNTIRTWSVIVRALWKRFLFAGLLLVPYMLSRVAQPVFLREIVLLILARETPFTIGYLYAVAMLSCLLIQTFTHHLFYFYADRFGLAIRNLLTSLIYKRLLSIATPSLQQISAAQAINLVASDVTKFDTFCIYFHYLWYAPLEALIFFVFLTRVTGLWSTIFGYSVLLVLICLQMLYSRQFGCYRKTIAIWSDKRIQALSEFINGCLIVKMFTWEEPMKKRIFEMRHREFTSIQKASYLRALNLALSFASIPIILLSTFGGRYLLNQQFSAVDFFTALAVYGLLRLPIGFMLPMAFENISETRVSANRIDLFIKQMTVPRRHVSATSRGDIIQNKKGTILIRDASFSWHDKNINPSSINLSIESGTFVGIIGPVGSGKSSLLEAILGEMNLVTGELDVSGSSFSYAPQSPWIFADTLRANILLGKPFDQQRYASVLQACCLDIDLNNFGTKGDLIVIGEKGVNLSGGQKARISLARALYADVDIYLLDNPLAAVDTRVARLIYKRCISSNGLLSKKTRLLVTHHTEFFAGSDQIVSLADGCIEVQDQFKEINMDIERRKDDKNDAELISSSMLDIIGNSIDDTESITADEKSISGSVSWRVWSSLFTASSWKLLSLFVLVIFLLIGELLYDSSNFLVVLWSKDTQIDQQPSGTHRNIYFVVVLTTLCMAVLRASYFFYIIMNGSNKLHNRAVVGLLHTSIRFFESNPSGRILNRASKDQQVIDEQLHVTLFDGIQSLMITTSSAVIISILNPWVLLLLIPLIPLCFLLQHYYLRSSRQMKRLESVSRSPIYALFASTFYGLATIRAFEVEDDFIASFMERVDANTRSSIISFGAERWFGLRLDIMTIVFAITSVFVSIRIREEIGPSAVALCLVYSINMTHWFQWGMRKIAEAESLITSAERIDEYARLPSEEDHGGQQRLIKVAFDWPSRGAIEFRNFSLRYRNELRPVLNNISLYIAPGEKIGIIGRTGAGKSSLLQSLFRLIDRSAVDGVIIIDDVDISRIRLNQLRSHLSIIPQQPMLFNASLRYNLDPLDQYSDEQCLLALEAVQLQHIVRNHPEGLLFTITDSGMNLSVGQRQLICVARAILKQSKILLIDEATANVDLETDALLQAVIADKFKDRTILTIAHRLNTVANSDRILVLDNGMVVRFDVPANILPHYQ